MVDWIKRNRVDLGEIRRLYEGSEVAKIILEYFASRKRNKPFTTVDRLHMVLLAKGRKVSRRDIRKVLMQLAELHCGEFILGRRGGETRMEWSVGFIGLGQAAAGQPTEITELTEDEVVKGDENEADEHELAGAEGTPASDMKIKYPLRPARDVEFLLPKDLTTREAHRLAEFIKTLPFDDATAAA
jgi:hypothetical protein